MNLVTRVFPNIDEVQEGHAVILMVPWYRWGAVREMLESEVYCGRPIRWRLGPGLLDATFEVIGPPKHVEQVEQRVKHWFECQGWKWR